MIHDRRNLFRKRDRLTRTDRLLSPVAAAGSIFQIMNTRPRAADWRGKPLYVQLIMWVATGAGVGLAPLAPGTLGALWGLPLAWAIHQIPAVGPVPPLATQALAILIACGAGVPVCTVAARQLGHKDPGAVVWDEIASMPITFFLIPPEAMRWPAVLVVGFALHRLFDITKPPPARQLERLPRGWGVMADDWAAGVYACAALHLCLALWHWIGP